MGLLTWAPVVTLVAAVSVGLVGYVLLKDGELPTLQENQFWGPTSRRDAKEDTSIKSFKINISEKVLTDLKTRLKLEFATVDERVADPLERVGFQWGVHKNFLTKVQDHWLHKYDWRTREAWLNKYPHFKTTISGIEIHFQHVKPQKKGKKGTRALLLLHGWPGSFVEYQKLIPQLVEPENSDINFELVIPSLPGFGFSEASSQAGLGPPEIAQIMRTLMLRLGHQKFYVQGGDWGSMIAGDMATMYKDNILGAHMTMCFSFHPRSILKFGAALALPKFLLDDEERPQFSPLLRIITNHIRETGYIHLQATKPETVGVALSYSPSGLASYILEKFSFWTDEKLLSKEDGGISNKYDLDTLLDNVMVHWVGKSTTSFLRIYAETLNPLTSTQLSLDSVPTSVPVSCRNYPKELLAQPKFALMDKFQNLVRFTRAKTGGHFSAFEGPIELAADIVTSLNLMDLTNQIDVD
ncbi:Juvenile hormone epoxide hydrolase 1 [Orchesella cincta]|uniref:Epoxide hydrolase n=1 Tax=Orchesella cincta TaxID=48709 RepID=A0A1D2NCJ2_ORCCI|nr:Juvenile hormone epoxide hydrolase 1 [Orchesella cincta]